MHAETHRLVERLRGHVVGEHLHVGPRRAPFRGPVQQRGAERPPQPAAPRRVVDVDRGQPDPPRAVGRLGDGGPSDRGSVEHRERDFPVDDRGQHVERHVARVDAQPVITRLRGQRDAGRLRCRSDGQFSCHDDVLTLGRYADRDGEQPVRCGDQCWRPACGVPVDDHAEVGAGRGQQRHGGVRPPGGAVAVSQQPTVVPVLLDARPPEGRGVLEIADAGPAHRRG